MQFPFQRGGGVNFSFQGGINPPSTQKNFSPAAHVIFDSSFFIKNNALNDIVSPPQAKIFINGVIKGQNQAIGMILHIII